MTVADKYGPNSAQVIAFMEATKALTLAQWQSRDFSSRDDWDEARCAAWDAAWRAVQAAPGYHDSLYDARFNAANDGYRAAKDALKARLAEAYGVAHRDRRDFAQYAGYAGHMAAEALVFRDHIAPRHFATLTAEMRSAGITFEEERR